MCGGGAFIPVKTKALADAEIHHETVKKATATNQPLLLVDGLSWLIGMANDASVHGFGPTHASPRLDILGGLDAVPVQTAAAVAEWRQGFEIVVFFDGPIDTNFKEATLKSRSGRSHHQGSLLRLTCRGERFKEDQPEGIAIARDDRHLWHDARAVAEEHQRLSGADDAEQPRVFQHQLRHNDLFTVQFKHTLAELGVRMVISRCEADFEIPLFAARPGDYDAALSGQFKAPFRTNQIATKNRYAMFGRTLHRMIKWPFNSSSLLGMIVCAPFLRSLQHIWLND